MESKDKMVVNLINATIQLLQSDDLADVVGKLSVLRTAATNGTYDDYTLGAVTGYASDDAVEEQHIVLTTAQELRLRNLFPVAYDEYKSGSITKIVLDSIRKVWEITPSLPNNPIIYSDVKTDRNKWSDYWEPWTKIGSKTGDAWVFVRRADKSIHLLHYIDNVFNAGLVIDRFCQKNLFWFLIAHDKYKGDPRADSEFLSNNGLKCRAALDNEFNFYVDDTYVLKLNWVAALNLRDVLDDGKSHDDEIIDLNLNDFVRGKDSADGPVRLTNNQMVNLSRVYPIAYQAFVSGGDIEDVRLMINDIANRYK